MLVKTLLLMVARPCHGINNVRGGPDQSQSVVWECCNGLQAGVEENSFTASPSQNCFSFHNL